MKLLSVCGGFLMSMPGAPVDAVTADKMYYDYRPAGDFETQGANCANALEDKTRYIQVEVFDYNLSPWIRATWTQVAGECRETDFAPYSVTMEYNGNLEGTILNDRLQMDMYVCGPWGDYELEIEVKSTNGGNPMERVAWEIEYGGDEYHIWDTLNTPFFGDEDPEFAANGALPSDYPYAPIPNEYSGEGVGTIYNWPLPGSEAYYSLMYTGPFPPLECPNLHPSGVAYVGCYDQGQSGWTTPTSPDGPTGSNNDKDPAERYRMFDGLGDGDNGLAEEGVMTLEKCAGICAGYSYFGLQNAIQCTCGDAIEGSPTANCDLVDANVIPEYMYLCSGDSRVLCGTDTVVSIYSLDGTGPAATPSDDYSYEGCSSDNVPDGNRVMALGPITLDTMSAEICLNYCLDEGAGYTYFGTEYGRECFCATTLPAGVSFGSSACTMPCQGTGNSGEICGGDDAISVYKITDATTPSESTPAPVDVDTPGPSGGDDYGPLGCFADNQPGASGEKTRIMTRDVSSGDMTAEVCFASCNDGINTHFGTQWGEECWCTNDAGLESINQFNDVALPCDMPCTGDAAETCGGFDAMTVYGITGGTTSDDTDDATSVDTLAPYTEKGCYVDLQDGDKVMDLLLPIPADDDRTMSAQICYERCTAEGASYAYFGLQYNYECWCSETIADSETTVGAVCDYPCTNNADEMCGGLDAISAYTIIN